MTKQKFKEGDTVYGSGGRGTVLSYEGRSAYRVKWKLDDTVSIEPTSSIWNFKEYDTEAVLGQLKLELEYPRNRRIKLHHTEVSGDTLYGYCRVDSTDNYLVQLTLTPLDNSESVA